MGSKRVEKGRVVVMMMEDVAEEEDDEEQEEEEEEDDDDEMEKTEVVVFRVSQGTRSYEATVHLSLFPNY